MFGVRKHILTHADWHDITYIYWRKEAKTVLLNKTEFGEKLAFCREHYKRINVLNGGRTVRDNFRADGIYDEYVPKKARMDQYRIYVKEHGEFVVYKTKKNGKDFKNTGEEAKRIVVDRFRKRTGLGRNAMQLAFGTVPYEWRKCTPKPLYYVSPLYLSVSAERIRIIKNVNSVDGCSQYPTALSGLLPTSEGFIRLDGTHAPSKEYPFALYIKSGHVAVFNEFDTHEWIYHRFAIRLFADLKKVAEFNPDTDETILMKASKYSFGPEMEYFFNIKETFPKDSLERDQAKLVMNAFIGMLHKKNKSAYNNFMYCHLACIALARANNNLLKLSDQMDIRRIMHICVDGIMYQGSKIYGGTERKLGKFEQEYSGAEAVLRATNCYMVKKDNKIIKCKHGAFDSYISSGALIEDSPPSDYKDMWDWYKTDNRSDYNNLQEYEENKL